MLKMNKNVWITTLLSAVFLALGGCKTGETVKTAGGERKPLPFTKARVPSAELLDDSPLGVDKVETEDVSKKEGDRKISIPSRVQKIGRAHV